MGWVVCVSSSGCWLLDATALERPWSRELLSLSTSSRVGRFSGERGEGGEERRALRGCLVGCNKSRTMERGEERGWTSSAGLGSSELVWGRDRGWLRVQIIKFAATWARQGSAPLQVKVSCGRWSEQSDQSANCDRESALPRRCSYDCVIRAPSSSIQTDNCFSHAVAPGPRAPRPFVPLHVSPAQSPVMPCPATRTCALTWHAVSPPASGPLFSISLCWYR